MKILNMKRVFAIGLLMLLVSFTTAYGQARVAYIDSEYILEQMPAYSSAQQQLDAQAEQWKQEVQRRVTSIDSMFKAYQAEYVILPETERRKREEEIQQKETNLNEYKKEKFGPDGELFRLRKQLIQPIQNKIFEAVQQLAEQSGYDIIFDKAGAVTMLYTNARYDRSDEVLELMGITVMEKRVQDK